MAEANRQDREQSKDDQAGSYLATGHPSVEQLTAEQGTGPIADVTLLQGDFSGLKMSRSRIFSRNATNGEATC